MMDDSVAIGHRTLDAFFRAIEPLDPHRIAALFTEDGELEDPVGSEVIRGRADIAESFANGLVRMVRCAVVRTVYAAASGDRIAAQWELTATTMDGREVRADGIDVITVCATGEIRRVEGYWDVRGFVEAAGRPG